MELGNLMANNVAEMDQEQANSSQVFRITPNSLRSESLINLIEIYIIKLKAAVRHPWIKIESGELIRICAEWKFALM